MAQIKFVGSISSLADSGWITCLDNLWRSLVRVPAGVFAAVEKELLSKLFDVSVQDGAHFDTKVLGINNGRSHDDWGQETNVNRE